MEKPSNLDSKTAQPVLTLTYSDGRLSSQATLYLKEIDGKVWAELDCKSPLDRNAIRRFTVILEELKDRLRAVGKTEIYAGCSSEQRVKWVSKLFGFEKIREVTVDGKIWSVVVMCF